MGGVTPLGALPSSIAGEPFRASERLDPYWDGVWQYGSHAQWLSREHADRMAAAGIAVRMPPHLRRSPSVAADRVRSDWKEKLDLLGVLSSWRTVTAEQAAAFAGVSPSSASHLRTIGDLFALDLIDTGHVSVPAATSAASRGALYRPSASTAFHTLIEPEMTYPEWVSVTGGTRFLTGGQYDRHNVLTAELALRLAEFVDIGTVLGERQAHVNTLAYTACGLPAPPGRSQQTADAVVVRPDGLRIAVETTASVGATGFSRKAESWSRTLARRPLQESGLVVLFVITDRTNAGAGSRHSLGSTVRKAVSRAVRLNPGVMSNRTAERMFVVDWREWFPARHLASDDFLTMRAERPSGVHGEWETVDMLNALDVPTPAALPDRLAVMRNASGLRGTPAQFRARRRPVLHDIPLHRAGFPTVPAIEADHRTGVARDDVSRARGSAGAILPPSRLRF